MPDEAGPSPLLPLGLRDTAEALQHALALRRTGLARDAMTNALNGVVAELLAEALISAGYVVSIRR